MMKSTNIQHGRRYEGYPSDGESEEYYDEEEYDDEEEEQANDGNLNEIDLKGFKGQTKQIDTLQKKDMDVKVPKVSHQFRE